MRDSQAAHALWRSTPCHGEDIGRITRPGADLLERGEVLLPVGELRQPVGSDHRRLPIRCASVESGHPHQPVGIGERQTLDEHRVGDRERRRRCANAKRQRGNDHGGKRGVRRHVRRAMRSVFQTFMLGSRPVSPRTYHQYAESNRATVVTERGHGVRPWDTASRRRTIQLDRNDCQDATNRKGMTPDSASRARTDRRSSAGHRCPCGGGHLDHRVIRVQTRHQSRNDVRQARQRLPGCKAHDWNLSTDPALEGGDDVAPRYGLGTTERQVAIHYVRVADCGNRERRHILHGDERMLLPGPRRRS